MSSRRLYKTNVVCEFTNGFAFKSSDYVPQTSETYEVLRMGYIERGGGYKEDSTPVFVKRDYGRDLRKYELKKDDVVMAMTDMKNNVAILGNTARIKHNNRFVLNQRVGRLRVKRDDLLDPGYLYYYSNWQPQVEYLRTRANSGVQVNLSTQAISEAVLELPELPEQQAVASLLTALDDKIDLNRRMNETLEQTARAIFKDWFVDFGPTRAKMAGQEPYLSEELWVLFPECLNEAGVPEGWRLSSVGEIADVVDCLHSKKPTRIDSVGYQLLQLSNIRDDGLLDVSDAYWITAADYEKWTSRIEASKGDCVITNVGRVGAVAQIPDGFKAALGRNMTAARCKTDFPFPTFLIEVLLSDWMRGEIGRKTDTGTILNALNVRNIPKLGLVLPDTEAVTLFERTVRPLRHRMEHNLRENLQLAQTRDLLLPRLMSGDLRVQDAEAQVAAVL